MIRGISTLVFLQQRLHTGLLDALQQGGAQTIEIFAARHHFDYVDRPTVREIADWFRSTGVAATLHQPLYTDAQWSRHVAPTINLIDVEKSRRIDAMDEVKRALEAAEQVPFNAVTLHLGLKGDTWSPRSLEHALTAIEHLKAFAGPLGVKVLLENLPNEVATPEHLLEIVRVGHFDSVRFALDLGHAHLAAPAGNKGIDEAFDLLGDRIAHIHVHDNHGQRDEHLWPGTGDIVWKNVSRHVTNVSAALPVTLEIGHELAETAESAGKKAQKFFDEQARAAERPPQPAQL